MEPCSPLTIDRFWDKVESTEHGFIWVGATDPKGYGRFWYPPVHQMVPPHRLIWFWKMGYWPDEIDHKCEIPPCVTFEHLQEVTHSRNMELISERGHHYNTLKDTCKHGHGFTKENTHIGPKGDRVCRICRSDRIKKFREREKSNRG